MDNNNAIKPCLVETRRGFSVLYKDKPLYSKYAPAEQIKKIISSLQILPNTLILCYSPLLGYGLEDLFEKLPENCFVLALEADKNLFDFSMTCKESLLSKIQNSHNNFVYYNSQSTLEITKLINNLGSTNFPKIGNFKRALPIEFSAGTQFSSDFYTSLTSLVDESISQFWRNRTTLIKLGRLFAGNFFKNLQDISNFDEETYISLEDLQKKSWGKTLLVLGTGISLEDLLENTKNYLTEKTFRNKLFIIAVDASLPVLGKYNIMPDLVVGVEGQAAIDKAYIGFKNSKINFSQDLLSRPGIKRSLKSKNFFFLSRYTEESFFSDFVQLSEKIGIPVIEPLGSVGLVAIELALMIRNPETRIYFSGLDFSYIPGKTHSKGAPIHSNLLSNCSKINSLEQFTSSYNNGTFFIKGKSSILSPEKEEITSKNLYSYGLHFSKRYKNTANLFDLSSFGVITGIPKSSKKDFINSVEKSFLPHTKEETNNFHKTSFRDIAIQAKEFLKSHNSRLQKIKNILIGNKSTKDLESLLNQCGYLYLHFPDGHLGAKLSEDFLKRVRAELNYFLKITET